MSIAEKELVQIIETIAPRNLEEPWDNCGRQINLVTDKGISRILVCLEVTGDVIEEAKNLDADYIIAHHPLIFGALKAIDHNNITGKYIVELITAGISVYSAHTTFDSAFGGNNDYLAELLGLHRIRKFRPPKNEPNMEIVGRIGDFEKPVSLNEICSILKEKLDISYDMKVVGEPDCMIKKVGLCTGAGGSILEHAIDNGCQLFITGDVKYHDAQLAKETGICLVDAGHFHTEQIFTENFAEKLDRAINQGGDNRVTIFKSEVDIDPFGFL